MDFWSIKAKTQRILCGFASILTKSERKSIYKKHGSDNSFHPKECLISAFDSSHQFSGVIKEVSNGALLIEKNGALEAINLDFVIRIREYPRDKKGKKKSVILD